ncbi:LapA family protein [Cellulomonas biazotea]|jgi:uncharacterized integral membrane protein|uniref:Lipopolysaccharide assembly protein A domain-containing protein n=1 Tax=Cellulomonas biazotea TaxID=1709 RepID=A0A402DU89_9CELL|nr:lipopolysaccharide assembly protein LapA domain-containing protein [Cellulomonas biazotea]GCE77665.1 hypothetical protein CBZ_27210 [Cellulomonas biazotea]
MPVQSNSTPRSTGDLEHPLPVGGRPARSPARPRPRASKPVRSRTSAAWIGVCVGALVLVALVVFMMQNTAPVEVAFLGMAGTAPLALVLVIAGLGVGVVALVVGALRIGQLRRRIRADRQPTLPTR